MTPHTDEQLYEAAKLQYGPCGPYNADADVQVDEMVPPDRTDEGAWVRLRVFVRYPDREPS